ncbi:MAG: alpha/beta hydrolase [Dehalococcoidia bacterium]
MPTARVNGIDIWYELSERPGPTLVLTHGFAGPTPHWPPVIDELRVRYRLLLYDVRGHGRTTAPDAPATYSLPQFAADLAGLLDALGIERPHVGGVSMGGMVSAQFACDFPDRMRSLLLCDTTAGNRGGPGEPAEVEQQLIEAFVRQEEIVEEHGMAELVRRAARHRHERDEYAASSGMPMEEQDRRDALKVETMTPRGYVNVSRAVRERPDLSSRTAEIAVPALVSCGEWDPFYPCAVRDHALIPGSRLATVRCAAHDTTTYQPALFLRAVCDFLDDVEAGRDVRGEAEYAP